jgi:signal transduction histidine kinase
LQQQKDDFIGIASHELKTPVTSIKAYTQVLEKILLKKGDVMEAGLMKKMDAQLNRLTNLIGDLLDVTKVNAGKLQYNHSDFDFNEMVKGVMEELQRTTEKHQLIADLKPIPLVFADQERLSQVVTNLITNAIKYSPDADHIVISTIVKDEAVELCVQDFGIGIANDKLDRVFEQFYRVGGSLQHTYPGLGLGLYISSEIIKREGGKIWVTSEQGKGSKFCFSIPLGRENNFQ